MAEQSKKRIRILCFGDSLTSGYSGFGSVHQPYETRLAELLCDGVPGLDVDTTEDGKDGDLTGFFMNRILSHFAPGKPKYDWTIILGGTNDIGYNYPPETVFQNLQKCWQVAIQNGSKVLALTVPEIGVRGSADEKRNKLNGLIKSASCGDLYVHDHHAALPYWSMSEQDRERYWDDGLHLTPEGYDLMGEKIAGRLLEIFDQLEKAEKQKQQQQQQQQQQQGRNREPPAVGSRRKKAFRDDDVVFEEETGDAAMLNRGYVVVRKVDLR